MSSWVTNQTQNANMSGTVEYEFVIKRIYQIRKGMGTRDTIDKDIDVYVVDERQARARIQQFLSRFDPFHVRSTNTFGWSRGYLDVAGTHHHFTFCNNLDAKGTEGVFEISSHDLKFVPLLTEYLSHVLETDSKEKLQKLNDALIGR